MSTDICITNQGSQASAWFDCGELASSANVGVATIKRFEACRRHPRAPQRQLGQGARGT